MRYRSRACGREERVGSGHDILLGMEVSNLVIWIPPECRLKRDDVYELAAGMICCNKRSELVYSSIIEYSNLSIVSLVVTCVHSMPVIVHHNSKDLPDIQCNKSLKLWVLSLDSFNESRSRNLQPQNVIIQKLSSLHDATAKRSRCA
jgi:hypothetical protein